ncbi:hypothetical protein pb186bvf_012803 [Paramecium bursaria]
MKSMLKAYAQVEKEADLIKSKATRQQKHIPEIGPRPNYRKSDDLFESKMSSTSFDKSNSRKDSIKKEISTLKQKRQQLEKESSTISQEYMKDILKKQLRGQPQIQEKDDILVNLEKAASETHKSYQKFRTDKLVTRIQYIISLNHNRHKREFINILKHKYISISQLLKDFQEFRNYNYKKNILHQWKNIMQFEQQERLALQKQNEEQGQHKKNTIAMEFRNFCLLNRGFQGFIKYKRLNQYTKKFEVDQDNIKQKVNQFLNEMKVNVQQQIQQEREEIENIKLNINKQEYNKYHEKKESQLLDKSDLQQKLKESNLSQQKQQSNPQESQLLHSNLSQEEDLSISKSNPVFQQVHHQFYNNKKNKSQSENEYDDNEFLDESLPDELEQSIQLSIQPQAQPYMNFQNESQQEQELTKQPKNPWKQEAQQNQSQSGQKPTNQNEQQRPQSRQKSVKLAKEFEEKAQQRKARQEEIKKKYEEKKRQQELEKQQQELLKQQEIQRKKEEEYNKLQLKKQREKELKEQKEREQFELNYKMEVAAKHHEKALQKFYIFIPLIKNYRLQFQQEDRAYDFYIQQSRRKIITYLKTAWTLTNEQRQYEENLNSISANTMHRNRCRGKIFTFIKTYFQDQKQRQLQAISVRNEYLKRNILTAWYIQLPNLQSENLKLERNQNQLVTEFRKAQLLKNYFSEWKTIIRNQIADRIKEQNKNQMWAKVNQWLSEFDSKQE